MGFLAKTDDGEGMEGLGWVRGHEGRGLLGLLPHVFDSRGVTRDIVHECCYDASLP